ncbi:MAG: GDSL-type esterase/lipase family protein [Chloroflexota bacterium]|nr:GDSL-type esterase/lipase family protein [Chloroflexota bacterium]
MTIDDLRICFVGDSFVNGTGDPACLGWTGRVCTALIEQGHGVTYYNLGIRRETSSDIAARWRQEVIPRLAHGCEARLVFSFGVNDTTPQGSSSRISYTDSLANTESILRSASVVAPTLMIGPQPIADERQNVVTAKLAQGMQEICASVGVPFLDVFTPLHKSTVWMDEVQAGDGAHPSAAGYAEFAGIVLGASPWREWFDGADR